MAVSAYDGRHRFRVAGTARVMVIDWYQLERY